MIYRKGYHLMSSVLLMLLPYLIVYCVIVRMLIVLKLAIVIYSKCKTGHISGRCHLKQAQEVIFSRKANKIIHSPLYINNATVKLTHAQNHLSL